MDLSLSRIFRALVPWLLTASAIAQTNLPATTPVSAPAQTRDSVETREQCRLQCIAGRRSICGKIVRVLPEGIVVESGYTNLLRKPLTKSWLVPGSVIASPAPNQVESKEPGAICVGQIFLTDLPRGKPRTGDYVIISGYPTGEITYQSVGTMRKTTRRFSASLDAALNTKMAALAPPEPLSSAASK